MARRDGRALVLILSVSATVAYGYYLRVDRRFYAPRHELHNHLVAGTVGDPYRYRILVPFLAEGATRALLPFLAPRAAFTLAYAAYDLAAAFFLLAMLFWWVRTWFTTEQALVGVLFVGATIPIALQDHAFQPWSLLEAGLFPAAFLAFHRERYWLLAFLVVVAALNKETAVFIPLALLAAVGAQDTTSERSRSWKPVVLSGGLLLVWAAVFGGLRIVLGYSSFVTRVPRVLAGNLMPDNLVLTLVNATLFLGGFWLLALLGFRYAPPLIRRLSLLVPIYLASVAVWGVWYEVRMLMPLYSVLVPLGLSYLYLRPPSGSPAGGR
jgi:hypothetical protein